MGQRATDIAAMRRFTRAFTRQAELLDEALLDSRFSLSEGRVLYELAQRQGPKAAELASDLGIDPGYLSRILKRFADEGLLTRSPAPADGRQTILGLSEAGREAFAAIDAASEARWARRISPLPAEARGELVAAMGTVERLLSPAAVEDAEVILRRHRVGDIGWIAYRQGLLYAAEYGLDQSFEALVAEILVSFVRNHDPARERAWIAERNGDVLGSVFLVRASEEVAKLRLLYVEPEARGLGLGARLVNECIGFARDRGYRTLTLWTNDVLVSARRIYEKAGFELVDQERHRSFGQDLVGQNWCLRL